MAEKNEGAEVDATSAPFSFVCKIGRLDLGQIRRGSAGPPLYRRLNIGPQQADDLP